MLTHTLILLGVSLGSAALEGVGRLQPLARPFDGLTRERSAGVYEAAERAVSNWRWETAARLEPAPVAVLAALSEGERPVVTRCVKLNNYWCIKSARWNGEIGTDEEGHVGFASAERSADAAATLLRRYYLEFGRKSALDIVRRWAPAECSVVGSVGPPTVLATRGIGGTVRARYLAARRKPRVAPGQTPKVAAAKPAIPRVSSIMPRAVPAFRVPDVAVGLGEKPLTLSSTLPYRVTPPRAVAQPSPSPSPAAAPVACAPDEQRLRNYAGRIVENLALRPDDDLKLFQPDGTPTENLAPVMLAMSAFELGHLRAGTDLVGQAVERQRERARAEQTPEVQAP